MKRLILSLAIALVSLSAFAQFSNPVLKGFYPDPSFCAVGEDYYMVNSSFQYYPGIPIFHSRDLVHWEQIGNVFDRPQMLPLKGAGSSGGIYAPTIRYHDGMFYMITTNVNYGGNVIVHATNPAGPWSDPVIVAHSGIDPSLFWDEDGTCWFTGTTDDYISLAKIDPMTGELLSKPQRIWQGTGGRYPEAPHIYKKDGWYYLMIAEGGTEMGHMETIARSRFVEGPYTGNPANPILTHFRQAEQGNPVQGTGHADLLQASDGSWWLCCLAFRLMGGNYHLLGRETFLAPVTWDRNGWPVVNGSGAVYLENDCPTLPQVTYLQKNEYDFSKDATGFDWCWLRNPVMSNYEYTGKALRLKATPLDLDEKEDSPTFIGRRQQDIDFTATTTLSLEKAKVGDKCGITLYMDAYAHYDLMLKKIAGGYAVQARYRLGAVESCSKEFKVPSGKNIALRVEGSTYIYKFSYSLDGADFKEIGAGDTKFLSTEAVGGFTGIMIGLFASGISGVADVVNFSYLGL